MINCLHIDALLIPPHTLFHTLSLHAHLTTTSVLIVSTQFDLALSTAPRTLYPNLTLKIPHQYKSVILAITPQILNMDIPPTPIPLPINISDNQIDLQLQFNTVVGVIKVAAHFVEQVTLPKRILPKEQQHQLLDQRGEWIGQCLIDRLTDCREKGKRSQGSLTKTQPPTTPPRRSLPHSQGSTV